MAIINKKFKTLESEYFEGGKIYNYGGFVPPILFPEPSPTPTQTPTITPTKTPTPTPTITPTITPSATPVSIWAAGLIVGGSLYGSKIGYSYDGINWNSTNSNSIWIGNVGTGVIDITYGDKWVCAAVSSPKLAYSYDAITWSGSVNGDIAKGSTQTNKIAWNGSMYVAVGQTSPIGLTGQTSPSIIYSYDGLTWSASTNSNSINTRLTSVAWNGSMWVAGGSAQSSATTLSYSYDGLIWSGSANGNTVFSGNVYNSIVGDIAWNGSMWLAGGQTPSGNKLAYSYDGINWSGTSIPKSTTGFTGNYIESLVWNGSMWVATGGASIAYSYNGFNWSGYTMPANQLIDTFINDIAWNGSKFVAVGGGGNISPANSRRRVMYAPNATGPYPAPSTGTTANWSGSTNGNIIFSGNNNNVNTIASKPAPNLYPPR
jgi:hypothetical protein